MIEAYHFVNYVQHVIQHLTVTVNSVNEWDISVDFNVTGQLLIIYAAFFKYFRKKEIQWNTASTIDILQESLWFR
jgi:hypothetical protein